MKGMRRSARTNLYVLANERLVFVKPSEQAAMDAADREFKQSEEGQQRCFIMTTPAEPDEHWMKALQHDRMLVIPQSVEISFIPQRDPADLHCWACRGKLFRYGDEYHHARQKCEVMF
ncbi:hypothetical protein SEA_EASTWEST_50 [Arthrobacter phage EastWest]|uniref:Uncharacterized protein n=1 Tax=Arthrobacter phage EastWest TaxID=2894292 RepID=A0AAE8YKA4_9CAUD|nr:hypothetical protein SEA_EASTWEST_50 [Arthrobacter phage EastWest]